MPKKNHTQEIPIKGRCIEDPLGMPIVMERLLAAPRLIHLQGIQGVGKTTFAFKVVFSLLEQKADARVLWIYFDDEFIFWKKIFEKLKPNTSVDYRKFDSKSPVYFHHVVRTAMETDKYRLVIVDGLHYSDLELPGWRRHQFLRLLNAHAKSFGLPILVTDRKNFPEDLEPEGNKDPDIKGTGESWRLHHPMYRNPALGEGNKFVIMPREMEWEEEEIRKRFYLP